MLLFLIISVCLFVSTVHSEGLQTVNGKIKVSVITTSNCRFTVNFIADQLVPTYRQYKDYLDIEFVPWGRTVRNDDGSLTCQFGANDCWANRLHRCVLNHLKGNVEKQVEYMGCEFTRPLPAFDLGSYKCALAAGMTLVEADYCVNNPNKDSLDEDAAIAAAEPMAIINAVPSIYFNDVIDIELHREALQRFSSQICFALAGDSTTGITGCKIES